MTEKSMLDWSHELASKDGKYGGGSAASVVGALAASLAQFVFELQQGKKKYAEQDEEIAQAIAKAEKLNLELFDLAEQDAVAFEPVLELYKLPQVTAAEQLYRRQKIDEGLARAAQPPFETMQKMDEVVSLFEQLLRLEVKGSIANDIVVGLIFAQATIDSEVLNCFINIDAISDERQRVEMTDEVNKTYAAMSKRIENLKEEAFIIVKS